MKPTPRPLLSLVVILTALLTLLLASCSTWEQADYAVISRATGVALIKDGAPAGAEPLGMVFARETGFYLLGLVPFRSVSIDRALRGLAHEAREMGADGVADIDVEYRTPAFFQLGDNPFPWTAAVQMTGEAYRIPDGPRPADASGSSSASAASASAMRGR